MEMNNIIEEAVKIDIAGSADNFAKNRIRRFKTGIFFNVIFFLLAGLIIAGTALYIIFMILKSL